MPLYTFFLRRTDGVAPAFETAELLTDDQAAAQANDLLKLHLSAQSVLVCKDDREVVTRWREGAWAEELPQHPLPERRATAPCVDPSSTPPAQA
jgi:hypothetical protein